MEDNDVKNKIVTLVTEAYLRGTKDAFASVREGIETIKPLLRQLPNEVLIETILDSLGKYIVAEETRTETLDS